MVELAWVLLILNVFSACWVVFREGMRRGGYLTLPFLTGLIFLTWYLPKAWQLIDYPFISSGSLSRLFFMSLLCFWSMVIGWHKAMPLSLTRRRPISFSTDRLFYPVLMVTLFALLMQILISLRPVEERISTQWSGPLTILSFLASVGVVSMLLSAAMIAEKRTFRTAILFCLNLLIYTPLILLYFRRADTFEFTIGIALALFFVRNVAISRTLLLLIAVVGFFFVNGVGHLRALSGSYKLNSEGVVESHVPTLEEISSIDWLSIATQSDQIGRSEALNAAKLLEAVERDGSLSLGAQFWNSLVFAYVPGQIVGFDFKQNLMVGRNALEVAQIELNFFTEIGTTTTGFVAPYQDFWYFGCLVWGITGYISGRFMQSAVRGSTTGYALYAATITNAVQVTTHFGYYFFTKSILAVLVIILMRYWMRHKGQRPQRELYPVR